MEVMVLSMEHRDQIRASLERALEAVADEKLGEVVIGLLAAVAAVVVVLTEWEVGEVSIREVLEVKALSLVGRQMTGVEEAEVDLWIEAKYMVVEEVEA